MPGNVVDPEYIETFRTEGEGRRTFNVLPPEDYEGTIMVFACVRLGEHAHVDVSSGEQVVQPAGAPRAKWRYSGAGHLILRWPEWELMRDALVDLPWVRLAEVERPTLGQLGRHTG